MSLSIRLKKEQLERLDNLSKETNKSKSFYVSKAIDMYLDELEFEYLMEQRLIDIRSGKLKQVPFEEIFEEILERNGLLD